MISRGNGLLFRQFLVARPRVENLILVALVDIALVAVGEIETGSGYMVVGEGVLIGIPVNRDGDAHAVAIAAADGHIAQGEAGILFRI